MNEHENSEHATLNDNFSAKRRTAAPSSIGEQPLILYDLATIIGAVYQQRITVTRQGTVTKRIADDSSLLPGSFKLTDFGASTFASEQISTTNKPIRRILTVQPSFELILPQFDPPTLYRLLQFTQIHLIEQASRLTLTRQSVLRGIEVGIDVDQMIAILKAASKKALPQNVIRTMKDWAETYMGGEMTELIHLKVSSEAVADKLCSSARWREYDLEKIAPRRLLAHHVYDPLEFRRLLKRAGIVLHD